MLLLSFLTFIFLVTTLKVSCSREITLSCGINDEIELTGEKGEPGVGVKGYKGEKGESGKWKEKLMRLEERVNGREQQLNESKRIYRRDCDDVAKEGYTSSGVYNITVDGRVVPVYCDMDTDGGNWLVFLKRLNGSENFFLPWENYTRGFGNVYHEFWLGLQNLHLITNSGSYHLRVDLEDWENNEAYALYSGFSIGDSMSNYQLHICGYSGTAGNSMSYSNYWQFTTHDRDNDNWSPGNCADLRKGAWWYSGCSNAILSGLYIRGGQVNSTGITWLHWKGDWYSMKGAEIKIRRN